MKFMTEEYVKEQAKLGLIPALKCSLKHHQEGRDADYVELKRAIESNEFDVSISFCAMCQFQGKDKRGTKRNCETCCLSNDGGNYVACHDLVQTAYCELRALRSDYSNARFKAFQDAEAATCKYIKAVIEQEEAKAEELSKAVKHLANLKCKESKRLVKDGDYSVRLEDYGDDRYIHVMLYNDIYNNFHGKNPPGYAPEIDIFQGNFFDLIAEQNKELDEFEINHKKPLEGKVKVGQAIDPSGLVYMRVNGGTATENSGLFHFDLDELDEFIAKLTQARNYARNHK